MQELVSETLKNLYRLFEDLILYGKEIAQEVEDTAEQLKQAIRDSFARMLRQLASREGWDKPAHLVPSGAREATEARNAAAVTRWHTAATGE